MANRAAAEREFPRHPDVVRALVVKALAHLEWPTRTLPDGTFAAVWTSPVFRFKDDLSITLVPAGRGTRVRVRSASRVGRYDFGQNARHIRDFFTAMEKVS